MRSLNWPGSRQALAASCAALCVGMAACSGGGSPTASRSAHPGHSHAASPTQSASAEPASGPAAVASVRATWQTFFNGAVPIPRRLQLLQDGAQFASFVTSQAKTSLGSLVFQASAQVSSVTLQPPGRAAVIYTILLGGKPLAKNLKGTAVYTGGGWKVSVSTFCGLLRLAYGAKSHLIPATCGS